MSLSTKSYSKESRSSSYYSRSSSYHATTNNSYNSSYQYQSYSNDRPLSTRLIERDNSYSSLSCANWDFDTSSFLDRQRRQFENDLLKLNFGLGRRIPISYREWNTSSIRAIPIQYTPSSSSLNRRQPPCRKNTKSDDSESNLSKRHDESLMKRENRISTEDWPPKQEPPTRKRSSMTIFIQRPFVDQVDVPFYRQTKSTEVYPKSNRNEYY